MQSIALANKRIQYDHKITFTYQIKITRTEYVNKKTLRKYVRYKIRIPTELQFCLKNKRKLYFSNVNGKIHIRFDRKGDVIYKCKIQRNRFDNRVDCSFNLSKKVFDIEGFDYLLWEVDIVNGKISDSVAELI